MIFDKDIIALPVEKYATLLQDSISPEEIVFLKFTCGRLRNEIVDLKIQLIKAESESMSAKLEEAHKRDVYMKLADILKEGREKHAPDKIKAVERFLRKQGFRSLDSYEIFEDY